MLGQRASAEIHAALHEVAAVIAELKFSADPANHLDQLLKQFWVFAVEHIRVVPQEEPLFDRHAMHASSIAAHERCHAVLPVDRAFESFAGDQTLKLGAEALKIENSTPMEDEDLGGTLGIEKLLESGAKAGANR